MSVGGWGVCRGMGRVKCRWVCRWVCRCVHFTQLQHHHTRIGARSLTICWCVIGYGAVGSLLLTAAAEGEESLHGEVGSGGCACHMVSSDVI